MRVYCTNVLRLYMKQKFFIEPLINEILKVTELILKSLGIILFEISENKNYETSQMDHLHTSESIRNTFFSCGYVVTGYS